MSTELNLLPCPFCGESESLCAQHVEGTIVHPAYFVKCDNCGAVGPATDKGNHAELWNRRASPAAAVPEGALPPLPKPWQERMPQKSRFIGESVQVEAMKAEIADWRARAAAVEADRAQRPESIWRAEVARLEHELTVAKRGNEMLLAENDRLSATADRAQQGEPVAYGATDFGYTLAGVELEEGDKRVLAFIVNSFGSDHPAVLDLTALLFRRAATKAAAPADALSDDPIGDFQAEARQAKLEEAVRGWSAPAPDTGIPTEGEVEKAPSMEMLRAGRIALLDGLHDGAQLRKAAHEIATDVYKAMLAAAYSHPSEAKAGEPKQ